MAGKRCIDSVWAAGLLDLSNVWASGISWVDGKIRDNKSSVLEWNIMEGNEMKLRLLLVLL